MLIADWIVIILIALFCLLGLGLGFGRGLKFFTKGIFGVFIAIFVCYCVGGLILNIGFVNELVTNLHTTFENGNGFFKFLASIRFEIVVYYVSLFIVVLFIRFIIIKIIVSVVEVNNVFMKIINKTLGVIFFAAVLVLLVLLVFQIIYAIGGPTAENFLAYIKGSFFKLDYIYENNPFIMIIKIIRLEFTVPA